MQRIPRTRAVAAVLCAGMAAGSALGLAGCTSGESTRVAAPALDAAEGRTLELGVTSDPVQQRLVESYTSEFEAVDREVSVDDVEQDERLPRLLGGELTVVLGCVGELLDELDPVKGQEMREMYAEAQDEADSGGDPVDTSQWRDIVHSTMFSALPTELQASDPGEAVGCSDESLPQNIVAVYRKGELDRPDKKALNNVAGGVTSDEVAIEDD
ncbi:MAG TPA: hypothetical protein H9870_00310 [Candidatus Corynebacterium avicola]|uniref:Uncharacterized protein n=1 Tax=Candidatus Corynebacterium avicola TaxID=2838527 RepID=A0A9D1UJF4_9CORY|nr:hypothetical protein [Candidatus Corynebacterium avicola]